MIAFPDIGYTPANLRCLLEAQGISRPEAAEMLGVSIRTIHYWCSPLTDPSHRDMPARAWASLIDFTQKFPNPPR